jgi:hypothetical protein
MGSTKKISGLKYELVIQKDTYEQSGDLDHMDLYNLTTSHEFWESKKRIIH